MNLARFAPIAFVAILSACAAGDPLEEDLPDMGDFRLSHNIVVADNMQQVPPSRNATPEEWEEILTSEIERRFGGYEGDRLYHIGISVDGYALAPPGIPLIFSPRSVVVISVNIWDDAAQSKLNEEPEQFVVFEGSAPETMIVGSGIARSRDEQMLVLARNAAARVQEYMLENPDWFSIDPEAAAAALAEAQAAREAAEAAEAAALEEAAAAEAAETADADAQDS